MRVRENNQMRKLMAGSELEVPVSVAESLPWQLCRAGSGGFQIPWAQAVSPSTLSGPCRVWSCGQGCKEYDPSQATVATFPLWVSLDFPALAIFVGPHLQGTEPWLCRIHGAGSFWGSGV